MRHYGLVLVVVGLLFFGFQAQAQITIDGISDDWQPNWQLDTNPPIPAPDNPIELTEDIDSVDMDVDDIYVIDDSNYLYVRIDMNELGDLYTIGDTNYYEPPVNVAIYIDADADSATGITWGWWRGGFDYMAYLTHNDRDSLPWGWMEDAGGLMYIYDQAAHPNWGFNLLPDTAITAISALSPYNWLESALPRDTMPDWGAGDSIGIAIVVQQAVTWLSDYVPDDFGSQLYFHTVINDFSGVEEHEIPERPKIIGLSQNHPNPFSKFTTLEFYLPEAIFVQLEIYDIQGRKVRSLKRGKFAAGSYTVTWDRKDYRGKRVPPGIYFCRLATNKKVVTRKMAVIP